jgi:hypothetical protein
LLQPRGIESEPFSFNCYFTGLGHEDQIQTVAAHYALYNRRFGYTFFHVRLRLLRRLRRGAAHHESKNACDQKQAS